MIPGQHISKLSRTSKARKSKKLYSLEEMEGDMKTKCNVISSMGLRKRKRTCTKELNKVWTLNNKTIIIMYQYWIINCNICAMPLTIRC